MSLCFPGQLRIKYPDVTGEFLIVNLTKGGTGLGKLNCKRSDQSNIHENYKRSFILKNNSHHRKLLLKNGMPELEINARKLAKCE